jgi:hypothetical protein
MLAATMPIADMPAIRANICFLFDVFWSDILALITLWQ